MMAKSTVRASAPAESLDARRNASMAAALRRIHARMRPSTVTAYLLTADARSLAAAMALDTRLGFTLTPGMAVDDTLYSTAAAYHTGEPVRMTHDGVRRLIHTHPEIIQYAPYPVSTVSVPIRTPRRSFGSLTLRWVPPRDMTPKSLEFLVSTAERLAGELERAAGEGASMVAPLVPLFIAESTREVHRPVTMVPAESVTTVPAEEAGNGPAWSQEALSRNTAFLYQFQRLATELTAAENSRDVVATTQAQVMRPFGGHAMALCLADEGRLRVAGAAGFSKEDLRNVDGLLLTRRAPETDATVRIQPMFFATGRELRRAYPDLDRYDDPHARSFLPLIANGRAVGCCVIVSDGRRRLRDDELAVLMAMLGQVGQSLERARVHEVEHAIAQSMQQGLLPRALPHRKEIVTTARYLPATAGAEVGGDWYDAISLPDGGIGLVIGDVEGHSLEAGGTMGQLRSGVRAYATEGHDPATVVTRSNQLLAELNTDLFATCCCLWLDLETGTASIAGAGHPAPVITDAGGRVTTPRLPVRPPLGVAPDTVYDQVEATLAPGSIVTLYTDGLPNMSHLGYDVGIQRLHHILAEGHGADLEDLADRLVGDSPPQAGRDDDMALLLARYEGAREGARGRVARVPIQRRDLQHVQRLRHYLRDLLPGWGLDGILDDLELLTSEVVTNALVHADTEVDVRLRQYPGHIRVEVRDSEPRPPVLVAGLGPEGEGNDEAETGRGMRIVDALASSWGSSPAGRGKTTWFELDIPS